LTRSRSLFVLAFIVLAVVVVVAAASAGCTGRYIRDTTHEAVQSTPERLARGSYLVNQAMSCGACHTTHEGNFLLTGERADMYLGGHAVDWPQAGFKFWIPNLTPDVETGLGGWSDDEIMRAIRDGIAKDGHFLFPLMPFSSYQHVAEEDLRAIVAYLRSVPPVKNRRTLGQNDFGFFVELVVNRGLVHHEPAHDVPPPARADKVKVGEYVMRLGHCWECHSATGMGPVDVGGEGFLSGWNEAQKFPGVGKVYFRNLTPDPETGLGRYSADQIKQALRTGRRLDGKAMAPPMSLFTPHLSGLSDEDLDALVAFLKSIPPYENKIPDRQLEPALEKALGRAPPPPVESTVARWRH
jgi:mono/diheme cytochrome c family protein